MTEPGILDYVMIMAALAVSWTVYEMSAPPSAGNDGKPVEPQFPKGLLASGDMALERPLDGPAPLGTRLARILGTNVLARTTFLDGAKCAYELILQAFADGNIGSVSYLVSEMVRATFQQAIADRVGRGETMSVMFIGIGGADIVDAGLDGDRAWIDVRFASQMVSVVRDGEGRIMAGDPRAILDLAEIWTFQRVLGVADPNWILVATDKDE